MAFADLNIFNAANSSTANQASITINTGGTYPVGTLAVLIIALDNNQTTDGDEGAVTGITDDASGGSNTWSKGAEFCNGRGAAQGGATCSIWYSQLARQLTGANVITAALSNATSRDKTAYMIRGFSVGAGSTIAVEGTPATLANNAADPGSLNVTTGNIECLRVRGIAAESNATTDLTVTASWTDFWTVASGSTVTTAGGGSAANMAVRGEFRINTATSAASDPTLFAADCASVYVAFKEVSVAFNTQKRNQLFILQAKKRASFY